MNEPENYICLFCESGFEETVCRTIAFCDYGLALFPKQLKPVHRKSGWRDELRPLLPGYVFMRGDLTADQLRTLNHVKYPLRYSDGSTSLVGNDLTLAEMTFRSEGVIPKLQAVQEGSFVRVTDPLLKDLECRVLRVEKRKRLAQVELSTLGSIRQLWLGLDLLEPLSESIDETGQ